jgi:hypothetical protein
VLFDKYQVNALDSNGSLDRKKVLCWNSSNTRADSERGDDGMYDVTYIIDCPTIPSFRKKVDPIFLKLRTNFARPNLRRIHLTRIGLGLPGPLWLSNAKS